MRLHTSLLEALADLDMHSSSAGGAVASGCNYPAVGNSSSDSSNAGDSSSLNHSATTSRSSSGVADGCVSMIQGFKQQQQQQQQGLEEWCAPSLDSIDSAATAGPVGGAKAAYVAAKLLAAAAWKRLGFESDPLHNPPYSTPTTRLTAHQQSASAGWALPESEGESESEGPGSPGVDCAGGLGVLLSSGGFLPSHHTIIHLLGGSADVLLPVRQSTDNASVVESADCGVQASDQGAAVVSGWYPCLYHPVYQDIDLA
jgi:hypothetical protein